MTISTRIAAGLTGALACLAIAAPANAGSYWSGNGTTTTKTDRFTGSVTTTYEGKRGDCGLTRALKSEMFGCSDINTDGARSVSLYSYAEGWEVMHYRNTVNNRVNVILTHKDGRKEKTTLPAKYSGDVVHGSTVMETVVVLQVPLSVASMEVQYGGIEYFYNPRFERGNGSAVKTSAIVSPNVCATYGEMCKSLGL